MVGIELGKAISEYGIAIITGIFLVLICWLVRHLITEQSKNMTKQNANMEIVLSMSKVEMKAIGTTMESMQKTIQKGNSTNASLNRKSITMIGSLAEYMNKHFNGCTDKVNFKKKQ